MENKVLVDVQSKSHDLIIVKKNKKLIALSFCALTQVQRLCLFQWKVGCLLLWVMFLCVVSSQHFTVVNPDFFLKFILLNIYWLIVGIKFFAGEQAHDYFDANISEQSNKNIYGLRLN